jgi:hypothetical protein
MYLTETVGWKISEKIFVNQVRDFNSLVACDFIRFEPRIGTNLV